MLLRVIRSVSAGRCMSNTFWSLSNCGASGQYDEILLVGDRVAWIGKFEILSSLSVVLYL